MSTYWKWVIGGGLAFWAWKAFAQPERVGNLLLSITFKPGGLNMVSANDALNAMSNMRQVCTGAPLLQSAIQAPAVTGNTVTTVISTVWTHDIMGPIKESVRVCYLNHLQAINPAVLDVRAERIS